jgi:hypothetical protein
MSDLEDKARPILGPLINGKPAQLSTSDQLLVARWFLKTIMVYEFQEPILRPFFTSTHRKNLYELSLIPTATLMYLAAFVWDERPILRTRSQQFDLIVSPGTPNAFPVDAYSATFIINHLVLQVFSFKPPHGSEGTDWQFKLKHGRHAQLELWPIVGNRHWPPATGFDLSTIDLFTNRWTDLD